MRATLTRMGAMLGSLGPILLSGCASDTDGSGSLRAGSVSLPAASVAPTMSTGAVPSDSAAGGTASAPTASPSASRTGAPRSTKPAPPPPSVTVTVTPERTGAHFVNVTVSHANQCTVGEVIEPVLTWTTKNATAVHVSVDNPGIVGSYGTYPAAESLTMPAIACTGPVGTVIERRYDLHAAAATPADHRAITVPITVVASP